MDVKLRPYQKDFSHSYSFGVFPTLELLKNRRDKVIKILLSPKGNQNQGVDKIKEIAKVNNIKLEEASGLINKLTESENTYALGIFNKFASRIQPSHNHLCLVNPTDTGNLGTIIRTMLGFNLKDLSIIKPGVDVFDPKVIRASMGAIFKINFQYFNSFKDYQSAFPQNYYPFLVNGEKELSGLKFVNPYSLIFGNEGFGLGSEYQKIGTSVRIDQSKDIDSLNLAVSVGIALYNSSKQIR